MVGPRVPNAPSLHQVGRFMSVLGTSAMLGTGEEPAKVDIDEDMVEKMRKYPEDFMLDQPPRRLFAYDWAQGYVSPFKETDVTVVDAVLDILRDELRGDSLVYDLGCGNGVFLIRAAQRYGCEGVGYDLDEALLEDARREAAADPSSAGRLQFLAQDLFTVDLSTPHVIFLYLLPEVLQRLRPCLEAQLCRRRVVIVSNTWAIEGLEAATERRVGKQGLFYVYRSSVERSETDRGDKCREVAIGEGSIA